MFPSPQHQKFIALMERLLQQPFAKEAEGYIVKFRRDLVAVLSREVIEPVSLNSIPGICLGYLFVCFFFPGLFGKYISAKLTS